MVCTSQAPHCGGHPCLAGIELKNLFSYGNSMDLGIENEALAFAVPYIIGFIGSMYALLGLFTIVKWKQSQETIRNLWKRTLVATPLLVAIFTAMHFGAFIRFSWESCSRCPSRILFCHRIRRQGDACSWDDCNRHNSHCRDGQMSRNGIFAWAGLNAAGILSLSLFLGAFGTGRFQSFKIDQKT